MVTIPDDHLLVLAHFGAAVATAQNLERLAGRLVALVEPPSANADDDTLLARMADVDSKALGTIQRRLTTAGYGPLADTAVKAIGSARNLLVHRYFWTDERSAKLNSDSGRAELIAELDTLIVEFLAATGHIQSALIRAGLDRTHDANPIIQRIRDLQAGTATGQLAASTARLVQASPRATQRSLAQILAEEQRRGHSPIPGPASEDEQKPQA